MHSEPVRRRRRSLRTRRDRIVFVFVPKDQGRFIGHFCRNLVSHRQPSSASRLPTGAFGFSTLIQRAGPRLSRKTGSVSVCPTNAVISRVEVNRDTTGKPPSWLRLGVSALRSGALGVGGTLQNNATIAERCRKRQLSVGPIPLHVGIGCSTTLSSGPPALTRRKVYCG